MKIYHVFLIVFLCLTICTSTMPAMAKLQQVQCTSIPDNGIRNLTYETEWDIPAESEDYLLGYMADVAYDSDGNICIVDFAQKNLLVFDHEGNWLRTLGREGEGPGELQDARRLFFAGDRYGLLQSYPAKIVWLNHDGSPSGKILIGGEQSSDNGLIAVAHATQQGSKIYGWISKTRYNEKGMESDLVIAEIKTDGSLGQALYSPPERPSAREGGGINEGKVYDIWLRRWTSDGQGGVWVAPERDRYILQHWNKKGELVLEVTRDYELVVRNESGRDGIVVWFKNRGWAESQIKVGETTPVVSSLRLGEQGNLWVKLGHGGKNPNSDLIGIYDLISPTGQYLEQVRFHCDQDLNSWKMLDDKTALILVTDFEDESIITLQRAIDSPEGN